MILSASLHCRVIMTDERKVESSRRMPKHTSAISALV